MQLYQLNARQYLPMTKQAAWEFLSDPKNLKVITPEHMGFHILAGADRPMFEGQIIQYRVSPFPGFKTKWVSEITSVKEGEYFVDEQRFGPYALWHHKHFIKAIKGGVEMEDIIDYKIRMCNIPVFMPTNPLSDYIIVMKYIYLSDLLSIFAVIIPDAISISCFIKTIFFKIPIFIP